jgi:hypothetical protein
MVLMDASPKLALCALTGHIQMVIAYALKTQRGRGAFFRRGSERMP